MRYALIAICLLTTPVFAQMPPTDALQDLGADLNAENVTLKHIFDDYSALQREVTALRAENAKLKPPTPAPTK